MWISSFEREADIGAPKTYLLQVSRYNFLRFYSYRYTHCEISFILILQSIILDRPDTVQIAGLPRYLSQLDLISLRKLLNFINISCLFHNVTRNLRKKPPSAASALWTLHIKCFVTSPVSYDEVVTFVVVTLNFL